MRREEGCRQYLMKRGGRIMNNMTGKTNQRPFRHIMPIAVDGREKLAEQIGVRGGSALLLSEVSPAQSRIIDGTGYGVKTPSSNLLNKLENLNVGKKRKNVNIPF
jgi:hypothetical protein